MPRTKLGVQVLKREEIKEKMIIVLSTMKFGMHDPRTYEVELFPYVNEKKGYFRGRHRYFEKKSTAYKFFKQACKEPFSTLHIMMLDDKKVSDKYAKK